MGTILDLYSMDSLLQWPRWQPDLPFAAPAQRPPAHNRL